MTDKKYEVLYRECLFQGYFRVDKFHLLQQLDDGSWSAPFAREVFSGAEKVAIVLLFDPHQDKVVLTRQFRPSPMIHGEDPFIIELAAGRIDPGETAEEAARREAKEETGCEVQTLQKIFAYYPAAGNMGEHHTLFIGRTHAPQENEIHGLAHEGEIIKTQILDASQAIHMLYMGQFRDAATIIAMQWFALHHTDLRSRWLVSDTSTPII